MIKETDESKITHRFLRLGAGEDGSVRAGRAWMRGLCSGDKIGTMSTCDFFSPTVGKTTEGTCTTQRRGSWKRGSRYPVEVSFVISPGGGTA